MYIEHENTKSGMQNEKKKKLRRKSLLNNEQRDVI